MRLSAGTRLGPYEIVTPLGAGGMGEVYRARDARLGREVAIKVLPSEVSGDRHALARFEERSWQVAWLEVEPMLDGIRDDPRFRDLARRVWRGPRREATS